MSSERFDQADVERCLAQWHTRFHFPRPIEQAFFDQTQNYRAAISARLLSRTMVVYNGCLLIDYLVLPATFFSSTVCHVIVSIFIILAGHVLSRSRDYWVREFATVAIAMAIFGQVLFIYTLNPLVLQADVYQSIAVLPIVYMNINQRPDYRFAVGGSLLMGMIYLVVLFATNVHLATGVLSAAMLVGATYLTLGANYRMERDARYAFLRRLQDHYKRLNAEAVALQDSLTGLANRHRLDIEIDQIRDASTEGRNAAALLLDVDNFKQYNDLYGHIAGDVCLKRIAGAIVSCLRQQDDLAVRFGGEEFLILAYDLDFPAAIQLADRIRRTVEEFRIPHHHDSADCSIVTLSIGVQAGCTRWNTVAELIAAADSALYQAKRDGRNCVRPALFETVSSRRGAHPDCA